MRKNVGRVDAYFRIMMGITLVTFGGARLVRKHDPKSTLMVLCGAGKLAEGLTRFCPMLFALHRSTMLHGEGCAHHGHISTGEPDA